MIDMGPSSSLEELQQQLESLRRENEKLKLENEQLNQFRQSLKSQPTTTAGNSFTGNRESLTLQEIKRYGRQLILPSFGLQGQLKLVNSSILVVGAGGLGAPVCLYLAAAGVGKIGIVDFDHVEENNLHRQIIHDELRCGISKSQSAKIAMERINSNVHCVAYDIVFDSSNALEIIKDYDVVIDATDNVATRYLLNDACVLLEKPLVSGSALRTEGQLTVYNFQNGPCYRCLFPVPPPAEGVTNCNDGGVLGPIVGVIGSMQALEAIKIVAMNQSSYVQRMLLFDGLNGTIRNIKLRPKQPNCCICGENPAITELIDYVQFCGSSAVDKSPPLQLLPPAQRISVSEYSHIRSTLTPHILLDVREQVQFGICSLEGSLNIPLKDFVRNVDQSIEKMKQHLSSNTQKEGTDEISTVIPPVYIFCRRGNDSQIAVKKLLESEDGKVKFRIVKDVIGGLDEWSKIVDQNFPVY